MKLPLSRPFSPVAMALLALLLAAGCGQKAADERRTTAAEPAPGDAGPTAPASEPSGSASLGDLTVAGAWARATPPGTPVGAVYFTLTNRGTAEDTLMALSSTAATTADLHETKTEDSVAQMRPLGPQVLSGGQSLTAEPGGLHVMLNELKAPLVEGERVPLTLSFKHAGALTVQVAVRSLTGATPHEHTGH